MYLTFEKIRHCADCVYILLRTPGAWASSGYLLWQTYWNSSHKSIDVMLPCELHAGATSTITRPNQAKRSTWQAYRLQWQNKPRHRSFIDWIPNITHISSPIPSRLMLNFADHKKLTFTSTPIIWRPTEFTTTVQMLLTFCIHTNKITP